ncbi:penicillin-binding protein PBP4(5) [Vagococcus intermedius]|uniref:Penicillin-binding transpeptidase domain-containing protein n=1 Tax=Vagococcus intermedius TaxID=2991418 RepID=A0AAF0I8F8_9ENTE|nr:penicillin-binding transpeptidase domain-containing protein [Vagococcus intermedius]WEG72497.1 penicillin-binding transpeptidase domain-containing protein [Vagococcus intermedius]WEG74584.1 penicillin-binding transpeptidase domain-containing protein [Vagococcus intermedius]
MISKKNGMLLGSIVSVLGLIGGGIWYVQNQMKPQKVADEFITTLEKQNYKKLSNYLTTSSLKEAGYTKDELIKRYETVFSDLEINKVKASQVTVDKKDGKRQLHYNLTMTSPLGKLKKQSYEAELTKVKGSYKINWRPDLIFPGMIKKDQIRLTEMTPKRGDILDSTGKPLATNKEVPQVGVTPGLMTDSESQEETIARLSILIEMSVEDIKEKLTADWVQPEMFVPFKTLVDTDVDLEELTNLKGVSIVQKEVRYYPTKEASAQLIGYTGNVTAEDLKDKPNLDPNGLIGKAGLEYRFDENLRGQLGGKIAIVATNGKEKKVLVEKKKSDGQDIETTLDSDLQQTAYKALKENKGATVVMNPQDGSLLSLVSSPSFNPNKLANGISSEEYEKYASNPDKPFLARFATGYAPGSTFKAITAAIGLDASITTPSKTRTISGLKWQKDASWGDYWVTRVTETPEVNMTQALVHSDNIYFAQEGLEMGEATFRQGLNRFIFGKKLNVPIEMQPAQISNTTKFENDILLADTAYGQGQLLINPIQQASMYSVFANEGKLSEPKLLVKDKTKELPAVISKKTAEKVTESLKQVVSDPQGTAHEFDQLGLGLAAKTGTAEIKEKQDTKGIENSFVFAFNPENPDKLLVSMVEDHKDNESAVSLNLNVAETLK